MVSELLFIVRNGEGEKLLAMVSELLFTVKGGAGGKAVVWKRQEKVRSFWPWRSNCRLYY